MTEQQPDPMVPADCDLRGLPFMPLDTVRLIDSDFAALATGEEFKAGVMLWCKAWQQLPGGSLPNDDRVLAHLSGAGARWKKLKPMALHGFVLCSDGRLYHAVIAEKALQAWQHRLSQRDRAARRWDKSRDSGGNATAYAGAHATGDATAMQGTGTGTVNQDQEPSVANAVPPNRTASPAAAVCARLRSEAGLLSTNPDDPRLLAALAAGTPPDLIVSVAKEFTGKPQAYVVKAAHGRHIDAATQAAGATHGNPAASGRRESRSDEIRRVNGLPTAAEERDGAGRPDAGRTFENDTEPDAA